MRMVGDDRPVPPWGTRLRRAICGLGLVWIALGAGIVIFHLAAGGGDVGLDRGLALVILGASTLSLGALQIWRAD